jgi:hypothetical protein
MRTTSAIRFICQKNGIQILSYLDDLAGCEEEHYCNLAFDFLRKLLQDCATLWKPRYTMAKMYSTITNLASDLEECKANLYPISL